jgi:hypothetical protein
MLHSIITVKQNKDNKKTYELSLFGVMLALFLVRYHDMDKLKQGLHHNKISFVDYYDKIAQNYQDKLPLIFGKWDLLTSILGIFSAYNFDIILSHEMRLRDDDKFSLIRGGNKELYDGIREIKMQTRIQLGKIANAGRVVWPVHIPAVPDRYIIPVQNGDFLIKNDVDFHDKPNIERINVVYQKLCEIILSLNPLEYGFSESFIIEPEIIERISFQLEKEFADEITAFYFLHLCFEYQFDTRVDSPTRYYSSSTKLGSNQMRISSIPKSCLLSILRKDKEKPSISEWYYRWMNDTSSLQKEIYEASKLMTQDVVHFLAKQMIY